MRRILLVLAVALVMAAMMAATAMPAFAKGPCPGDTHPQGKPDIFRFGPAAPIIFFNCT